MGVRVLIRRIWYYEGVVTILQLDDAIEKGRALAVDMAVFAHLPVRMSDGQDG